MKEIFTHRAVGSIMPTRKLALSEIPGSMLNDGITEVEVPEREPHMPINNYGVLIKDIEQARELLKKVWDALFFCELERDNLGRELNKLAAAPRAAGGQCEVAKRRERAEKWAKDYEKRSGEGPGKPFYIRSYMAGYFNHPLTSAKPLEVVIIEQFEALAAAEPQGEDGGKT